MGTLIKGKPIAADILEDTAKRVAALKEQGLAPKLAVVLVGDDKPSHTYVRKKGEAAEKVGLTFELHTLKADVSQGVLLQRLAAIQEDQHLCGLIVQLPLPEHLYTNSVLNAIRPELDVDCLTDVNLGRLIMKTNTITPPTPGAVIEALKTQLDSFVGLDVAIVGVGALVGKPLAVMMMNERASVTTINSASKHTAEKCLQADIIVTGVGKKDLLRGSMVKEGAIVIDTGVDFKHGKMYGDVNVAEVQHVAAAVTPTPGGIGPITVARLLMNTVKLAEEKLRHPSTS